MKNIDVLKLADEVEMWGEDLLALNMKGGIPVVQGAKMLRQLAAKLECYERLVDASEMASNPMGVKSRVALKNVREMKTIMTKEEEILRAEREWDELSIRYTEALKKSMQKTNDDYWDSKKEELKGYSLAEREYIKAMATSIAGACLAGFNKKEKNI